MGALLEAVEAGKPGTNWKQVTPAHRSKISAIVKHYMKEEHPFTACVTDNTKRFGPERAKRVCAVVKDLGERTTKWRKGGSGKVVEAAGFEQMVEQWFDDVAAHELTTSGVTPAELAGWVDDAAAAGLLVEALVEPDDLTPEQLEAAGAAARGRLDLLDRMNLPHTGAGATYDTRLVEAASSPAAVLQAARQRANANRREHPRQASDGDFEGKHRRGPGGKWITMGSSGTEVRAVQRRVGARVDGSFGDKTQAAVKSFQQAHGLTVDGIVGRQTIAALRGRKDASKVKVGAASSEDFAFLRHHVQGSGRKVGSKNRTRIVEAVNFESVLDRVRGLEPGELAMLPDGGAVKHVMTPDAREVWLAGSPSRWSSDGSPGFSGKQHRSAEDAVVEALTDSASRTDPDSLGGPTRFNRWTSVISGGRAGTFRGVNADGEPLVSFGDDVATLAVAVPWGTLDLATPAPRMIEAAEHWRNQPRDDYGKWRDTFIGKARGAKPGEKVHLPGGLHIAAIQHDTRRDGKVTKFAVADHTGKIISSDGHSGVHATPEAAAQHALDLSARSGHADSLGGATNYKNEAEARATGATFGTKGTSLRDHLTVETRGKLGEMPLKSETTIHGHKVTRQGRDVFELDGKRVTANKAAKVIGYSAESNHRIGKTGATGEHTKELYRDAAGHEVWRIKDPSGKVVQSGISSDHDVAANLRDLNARKSEPSTSTAKSSGRQADYGGNGDAGVPRPKPQPLRKSAAAAKPKPAAKAAGVDHAARLKTAHDATPSFGKGPSASDVSERFANGPQRTAVEALREHNTVSHRYATPDGDVHLFVKRKAQKGGGERAITVKPDGQVVGADGAGVGAELRPAVADHESPTVAGVRLGPGMPLGPGRRIVGFEDGKVIVEDTSNAGRPVGNANRRGATRQKYLPTSPKLKAIVARAKTEGHIF